MLRKTLLFALAIGSIAWFSACINEDDFDFDKLSQTTINPALEANVLSMEFTARDFFNQIADTANGVEMLVENDSSLTLRLTKDFEINPDELGEDYFNRGFSLNVFDFELEDVYIPSLPAAFPDDYNVITNEQALVTVPPFAKFNEDDPNEKGRIIDSVILASGSLNLHAFSSLPCAAKIIVHSDNIIDNTAGKTFSDTITVGASETISHTINLAGRNLSFLHKPNVDDTSYLGFTYSLILLTKDVQLTSGNYAIDIKLDAADLLIETAYGKVGNPTVPVDGVLELNYFADSTITSDMVDIRNINMSFDVYNHTGINATLDLTELTTRTRNGHVEYLFNAPTQGTIVASQSVTQPQVSHFTFQPNTEAIEKLPNEFNYNMKIIFGDGSENSFIHPNQSYLDIHSVIDIPVAASVKDFVSQKETGALDFLQGDGVGEYINSAELKLDLSNSFPAELKLELYVLNAEGVYEPLLDKEVIASSASIDAQGNVTAASSQKEEVGLTKTQFEKLRQSDKVMFKATFNTPQYNGTKPHVVFRSDCGLKIKLRVKVNSNIEF
ncbi:MAG: hypothetical protein J6M30_06910 [Bacteroidales bacterium]|nr:hypothetical protein [Bacteroidales bacterium]